MQGPDLEALPNALPPQNVNRGGGSEATNHRKRQTGEATPLVQPADTVQLSQNAVQAASQLQSAPPPAPVAPAPKPAVAPAAGANAVQQTGPAQPQSTPHSLAQSWAASPARQALEREPEVRPDQVAQAQNSLGDLGQGGSAADQAIAQKLLTGA